MDGCAGAAYIRAMDRRLDQAKTFLGGAFLGGVGIAAIGAVVPVAPFWEVAAPIFIGAVAVLLLQDRKPGPAQSAPH